MTEKLSDELQKRCEDLEENLKRVREDIADAAVKSGRKPEDITLLAATKTVPAEVINRGLELGLTHIGENRVQELEEKYGSLRLGGAQLHFIGHLQTNKVKNLIGKVTMIQSVDSEKLAREISRLSEQAECVTDVLLEINIGGEASKSGVEPARAAELLEKTAQLPGIRVRGLMAIPPAGAEEKQLNAYFSNMFQYFIDMKRKKMDNSSMDFLSMGMSADYRQAILAGANMVRIGSTLFGQRIYR